MKQRIIFTFLFYIILGTSWAGTTDDLKIIRERMCDPTFDLPNDKRPVPTNSTNLDNLLKSLDQFNTDGSYKGEIPYISESAKHSSGNKWDKHRAYLSDVRSIAVLYGYNNYYPESIPAEHHKKTEYKELIYKTLKWYFANHRPPISVYHETFSYHDYGGLTTGLLDYIGMLLFDDFHADRKTDASIQKLYEDMMDYGHHTLTHNPQSRGPNWAFRYGNCMRHVLFSNDPAKMDAYAAVNNASIGFDVWAENGTDGPWPDWSLTHHGDMKYWGMYGNGWFNNTLQLASSLEGSPWEYSTEKIQFIETSVYEGLQWILFKGNCEITTAPKRLTYYIDRTDGVAADVIDQLKFLVQLHGDKLNDRSYMEYLIKNIDPHWKASDKIYDEVSGQRYYWHTEYQVHRRSNYSIAVRRCSQRARGPEDSANSDIKCHLHFGSGYTSIQRRGDEYRLCRLGMDYQTIPGTTTELNGIVNAGKSGSTKRGVNLFSGGASEGGIGAGAMEMKLGEYNNGTWDLVNGAGALKGNFFFSNEMVCLGQEVKRIKSGSAEIWTTINQLQRRDKVVYSIDKAESVKIGINETVSNQLSVDSVAWFWHDEIGYIISMNSPGNLKLMAERRTLNEILMTDNYKDAISKEDKELGTINMFQLAINHGVNPENDFYQYRVIPDISLENFKETMKLNTTKVIQNSDKIQAVYSALDQALEIVFYEPGELEIDNNRKVKVDKKAIVLLRQDGDKMVVSASNPVHRGLTPSFVNSSSKTIGELYETPINIELSGFGIVNETEGKVSVPIQLPTERGYEGQTISTTVNLNENGGFASVDFPLLNEITISDSLLANFSPTRFHYKIEVCKDSVFKLNAKTNGSNTLEYFNADTDTIQIKVSNANASTDYEVIILRVDPQPTGEILDEYTETFTLLENTGGFMSKPFVGDYDIIWTLNSAKYATYQGTGGGIYLRGGYVESETLNMGISDFSVTLLNHWNEANIDTKTTLYINDQEKGSIVNNSNDEVYTFEVKDINIAGEFKIKLKNTSVEKTTLVIDNISWKPYATGFFEKNLGSCNMKVYPNPFTTYINIEGNEAIDWVELYRLSGEKMMKIPYLENQNISIPVTLSNGLYVMKLSGRDFCEIHKLLKVD